MKLYSVLGSHTAVQVIALVLLGLGIGTAQTQELVDAPSGNVSDPDIAAFEADLFGDISADDADQTVVSENSPALLDTPEAARTEYLVGGTVVAQAAAYFTTSLDEFTSFSNVSGKLFAKVSVPDYGALYIAYNASHNLFQGYSGPDTPPPASNPYEPAYSLAELHYSFDVAKVLFARIGNQLIAWGPSRIWSPVDFINLEKSDAFAALDSRAGKPGLRLHLPLSGSNAFLFADFSGLVQEGTIGWIGGDPLEAVNLAGRFDFTAGPFEIGITAYGGKNAQARIGLDASGRLFGTTVYGEYALQPEYDDYLYSMQASIGFSRTLGELKLWTLSAEGFYNSSGQDLTGYSAFSIMSLPLAERTPLYQGKLYAYAALAASELFSPSLSTTLSVISNLSDYSYSIKLAESFSFPRAVPFSLSVSYSGGGEEKEFTRYSGEGAMSVSVSTRLEF